MSIGKRQRPLIVPIFISNQGCPYQCIYCNQEKISGQSGSSVDVPFIKKTINRAMESPRFLSATDKEIAFYGGTFTNLTYEKMLEYLKGVAPYLSDGSFRSIRISTRPDLIDAEKLDILKRFGVSTVELGVQSMDNEVLRLSGRGYRNEDVFMAVNLLREHDFRIGVQLMPGLPGDSDDRFRRTIEDVIDLKPDMARLYPAVVLSGTGLAELYHKNRYQPLDLEKAVDLCSDSCIQMESRGIIVIRIGLMSSPSLLDKGQIIAGPWHSAFGFLVRSAIHQKKIRPMLPEPGMVSRFSIRAPLREIPLIRGYKNQGLHTIEERTGAKVISVIPDEQISSGSIRLDFVTNHFNKS
ncbi:MAG: radical SAM protein [Deltaproteobacteria bacterium]|nr:radical SAM protein [Deltaproteobacteria bacterium]